VITIPLSADDLAKVRVSPSPLWEAVFSSNVLVNPGRHRIHQTWVARTRRALGGAELSALLAVVCVDGHCPDFLTPAPDASAKGFDDELERLRATAPEVVHAEVGMLLREEKEIGRLLPAHERALRPYLEDPEGSLERLVDALRRYHERAIAPYWPRMRALLEGDLLRRGQALALGGAEMLLSGLDPTVGYEGGVLRLEMPYEAEADPAGGGITLVPCVFSWSGVSVLCGPHSPPTLAYAPRGVANLWASSSPAPGGTALGAALGASRASVLKGLLPAARTTTELALDLRLSPASVSAHLSRLRAAGLVEPHRHGRGVYYRLTCAGESLLGLFGETG
jgi:DNA-binding transcriptional ArsR family regulator